MDIFWLTEFLWTSFFALIGIAIGSFLNLSIDRIPNKMSLVSPPSHCTVCKQKLAPKDLIPIFSYIYLRGRCRYCRSAIPKRTLVFETIFAVLFAYLYLRYSVTVEFLVISFYCCLFIIILVIDQEHGIIPNRIVYPSLVISLVIAIFTSRIEIANAAIGGGIGLVIFSLIVIISRGGMGIGDIKMAALIGVATGFPMVFVALLLAVLCGGTVALVLLLGKIKGMKEGIRFGPYLSVGAIATLLWGDKIIDLYLNLIQF